MNDLDEPELQVLSNDIQPLVELEKLARFLNCSRKQFEVVFDQQAKKVSSDNSLFKVIALGCKDKQAFIKAMQEAYDNNWLGDLWEQLISAEFVESSSDSYVVLQQFTGDTPDFIDGSLLTKGMIKCIKQVCLVEVKNDEKVHTGSGFLIGPNAIITSGHVISCLLDEHNQAKPESDDKVTVRFDHLTDSSKPLVCNLLKPCWLLDYSPAHPDESDKFGRRTIEGIVGERKLDGYLDYAVLALSTSPGFERGVIDLNIERDSLTEGERLWILQHPQAFEQQVAEGKFEKYGTDDDRRLLYSNDTSNGSSGGLVVDDQFQCVGLHQGAIEDSDENGSKLNTGIAIDAIRKKLKDDVLKPHPSAVPLFRRANDAGPIIGRENCRKWIHDSVDGVSRINYVYSSSRNKGTSFSYEIMQACLPDSEHVLTRVSTDDLGVEALETAEVLLKRMSLDNVDSLPDPVNADTASAAWIKDTLLPAFRQLFNSTAGEALHWLIINDIDKEPIADSGVRLFLDALYAKIESMPRLRIVLIGQDYKPPSANEKLAREEIVDDPYHQEIERYIQRRYVQRNIDFFSAGGETERLASLVERSGSRRIEELDEYIKTKFDPMINSSN